MNQLEKAREIVRAYAFKDLAEFGEKEGFIDEDARGWYWDGDRSRMFFEMDADTLAHAMHTYVEVEGAEISDEKKLKLGTSKLCGLPHLPKSMKWPEGHYFLAQLALADVKPFDAEDLLPDRGMLYFFFAGAEDCSVIHVEDASSLELRDYPDDKPENAEYYLEKFLERACRVTPKGKYIFYAGGDAYDYKKSAALVTKDLRAKLDKALPGFSLSNWDADTRLFGRPHFWQGEDEEIRKGKPKPSKNALLFEDEFGEGHVHFWIERKHAAKRDYSKCWLTYSGT